MKINNIFYLIIVINKRLELTIPDKDSIPWRETFVYRFRNGELRMENERGDSACVIYSFVLCDAVGKCVLNLCTDFVLCACTV